MVQMEVGSFGEAQQCDRQEGRLRSLRWIPSSYLTDSNSINNRSYY